MPIPQRPRVDKYLVLKWEDVHNLLNSRQVSNLIESYNVIHQHRVRNGTARQYVTVSNKDLSLFDEVWGMVLSDIQTSREEEMTRIREQMPQQIRELFASHVARSSNQPNTVVIEDAAPVEDSDEPVTSESAGVHTHSMASARRGATLRDLENSFADAWVGYTRSRPSTTSAAASTPEGFVEADGRQVNFTNPWSQLVRNVRRDHPNIASDTAWQISSDSDQIAFDLETQDSGEINNNLRFGVAD